MSTEAKVGSFVLAGLILLGWAIFLLGDISLERHYPLYADFADVSGLPDKAIVKLSGVEVGKVKGISLREGGVRVELEVRKGVQIYADSKFRVGATSIIGSKFLEINQGHPASGVLQEGAIVKGDDSLPMERMITDTLSKVQLVLDDVRGKGKLGENLNAAVENLRQTTITMNELLAETKPALSSAMNRADDITLKLDNLLAKADEVMAKINSSSGTVGALIGDVEMKDDVKQTVKDFRETANTAKNVLGRITGFHVYWHYTNRYEPTVGQSHGDVGVRIYPREGRYYYLGLSNLSNPSDRRPNSDFEERNNLEAQLGWDWTNLNFHTGLIRGTGGAGFEWKPIPGTKFMDRLWLFADASDFLRNRTIRSRTFKGPKYDVGARVQAHRLVSVGARVQDVAELPRLQGDVKIAFEDSDIAYLFGLVSFGAAGTGGRSK